MKNYRFTMKTFIQILVACLLPISVMAQLTTPENIPITFYGKVIDQNKQTLAGAKVTLEVVISHFDQNNTEQKPVELETDQNGAFTLTGFTAHGIDSLSVEKEGYELSKKTQRSYIYTVGNIFHPDPNNPVVFKMWKKQGKEKLNHSAWYGKVACDGTTNRFVLFSGHPSPEGNLQIICTRKPLNYERTSRQPYDYKFEIAVIGGSIQATEDEFTYLAPDASYSPTLTIERKSGDPK
jgi:hypothetical protein